MFPPNGEDVDGRWAVGVAAAGVCAKREANELLCIAAAAAISARILVSRSSSFDVPASLLILAGSVEYTMCPGTLLPSDMM